MKNALKYSFVSLLFVLVLTVFASGAYAEDDNGLEGFVKDGGVKVQGASVVASCTFEGVTRTKTDTTGANGAFEIEFKQDKCDTGALINIVATKGSKSASKTFNILAGDHLYVFDLNLQDAAPVPEFGLLTGIGALISSAGAYLTLKKRS